MPREIERKFLVRPDLWNPGRTRAIRYRQGYLSTAPQRVVRVRLAGRRGFITVKGITVGIERQEFEYVIPAADAVLLLDSLCMKPLVEKQRYRITYGGRVWEVDQFEGENGGLIVAEVELPRTNAKLSLPPWIGREVSDDPRYYNSNLAIHPYRTWAAA
jgi:CYTH domain-containing protein